MRQTVRLLAAVAAAFTMAGCGTAPVGTSGQVPDQKTPDERGELVLDGTWYWIRTAAASGAMVPADTDRQSLDFGPNGELRVLADCNDGKGTYRTAGNLLTTAGIKMTPRACRQNSEGALFVNQVSGARTMRLQDGLLYLSVAGGQTMSFARDPAIRLVDYVCPNRSGFSVVYHARRAQLRYAGASHALPDAPQGGGLRYTDGRVTLILKPGEAQVEVDGRNSTGACKSTGDPTWRPLR